MVMNPRAMTSEEYERWVHAALASYAEDKVATRQWSPGESLERLVEERAKLLARGVLTPGNHLLSVLDGNDQPVGALWFAVKTGFNTPVAQLQHRD